MGPHRPRGHAGAAGRGMNASMLRSSADVPTVRAREFLLVIATFTLLALAATMPLATHMRRALPSDLLDTLLNAWIIGWDSDRLRHGLAGVWNAPIFYPYANTL